MVASSASFSICDLLDAGHLVREMLHFSTLQGAHREVLGEVAIVGYQSESRRS